jgi:hypothetical protein
VPAKDRLSDRGTDSYLARKFNPPGLAASVAKPPVRPPSDRNRSLRDSFRKQELRTSNKDRSEAHTNARIGKQAVSGKWGGRGAAHHVDDALDRNRVPAHGRPPARSGEACPIALASTTCRDVGPAPHDPCRHLLLQHGGTTRSSADWRGGGVGREMVSKNRERNGLGPAGMHRGVGGAGQVRVRVERHLRRSRHSRRVRYGSSPLASAR